MNLDPETSGADEIPEVVIKTQANDIAHDPPETTIIFVNQNNFEALDVVVIEDYEDDSQDNECVDDTQLMEEHNDTFENSLLDNNEIFL